MQHSVFAMELALRIVPGDKLRSELSRLVLEHPATSNAQAKWEMYRRAGDLLLPNLRLADYGCWDFFDDDAKARSDYDMWCNGMITEEGARKQPSGPPGSRDVRYMTYTMSFLMLHGAASERALCNVCDIPTSELWRRDTFARVLRGVRGLSFASVKSDVAYVIPRDEDWGLTAEDLKAPKFEYLRKIE